MFCVVDIIITYTDSVFANADITPRLWNKYLLKKPKTFFSYSFIFTYFYQWRKKPINFLFSSLFSILVSTLRCIVLDLHVQLIVLVIFNILECVHHMALFLSLCTFWNVHIYPRECIHHISKVITYSVQYTNHIQITWHVQNTEQFKHGCCLNLNFKFENK